MSTEFQPEPLPTEPQSVPQPQPPEPQAESPVNAQAQPETPPIAAESKSAPPKVTQPKKPSADRPSKSQLALQLAGQLWGIIATTVPLVLNLLIKVLKWLWTTWNAVLPKIRALLPEPWKTRLPNQIFTAIALALLLLILAVPSWLSPERPAAIARTDEPVLPAERPKAAPVVDTTKLAKIQERIVEVSDQYAAGLVQSIKANRQRLTVTVTDDWYALLPEQQDKLVNEVLKRSQKLKFDRLELTDASGTLLARSPMVGTTMLVLERVKEIVALPQT
jgi:hypothetical protein